MQLSELQQIIRDGHIYATRIGAYGDDPQGAILAKLREEVNELESAFAFRWEPDIGRYKDLESKLGRKVAHEKAIKNTDADEFADIIITCLAACEELGIDIAEHIRLKQAYNQIR